MAEKEFDFGTIRETDGNVFHDFIFTNEGKVPLIIQDVKSTCGCTIPEWPKEPVLPGKTGKIRVIFDPAKQSGAIVKQIQVVSNTNTEFVLFIRGIVIPSERVEEVYKFTIGNLRLQTIYAAFGEIYKGKTARYSIRVFNNSNTEPAVITFANVPAHITIKVKPEQIDPQQDGIIEIEYNTTETVSWDYAVDRIKLLINGIEPANNRINITANIKEDFSALTAEEMANAARAEFNSREFNFGTIPEDKIASHIFIIHNIGKSNLIIRKVSASCGCTAVQPAKTIIQPGDSAEIKALFNARGREGTQKKAITIITNDPRQSRTILWINANVEKNAAEKLTNP
jgi:hypothetical protein